MIMSFITFRPVISEVLKIWLHIQETNFILPFLSLLLQHFVCIQVFWAKILFARPFFKTSSKNLVSTPSKFKKRHYFGKKEKIQINISLKFSLKANIMSFVWYCYGVWPRDNTNACVYALKYIYYIYILRVNFRRSLCLVWSKSWAQMPMAMIFNKRQMPTGSFSRSVHKSASENSTALLRNYGKILP